MKHQLLYFLKILIPFTVVLLVLHYFAVRELSGSYTFYYSAWSIYAFHFIITFLIYTAVLTVSKNLPEKTGFAFLACSGLKMFAAVIFLVPLIKGKAPEPIADVAAFFIPYFLFLFFETVFAVKLLK